MSKTAFANEILSDEFNLLDCWRILNPDLKRYTWRQSNPIRQSIIDYWLISRSMFNMIDDCDIQPSYKSVRSLITLDIKVGTETEQGPGMLKFNMSMLKYVDYVQKVNTWLELKCDYVNMENKALTWELSKCQIRR